MRANIISIMKKILVFICFFILQIGFSQQNTQKPNIIFVLADDMGYGDTTPYGQKIIKTPHLQKLSDEGMTFTNFYAGSTVCAPSRASFLTGQHTGRTKVRGNGEFPLDDEKTIFPQLLKQAGYRTAIFGKWGMGLADSNSTPEKKGFDNFVGFLHHIDAHFQTPKKLDVIHNGKLTERTLPEGTFANDILIQETLNFIKENASEKPFFIYLSLTVPHAELSVPKRYLATQLDENGKSIHPNENPFKGGHYGAQQNPKATYAAMVTSIDDYVGQIDQLLKKEGIEKNTLLIFASDNGTHIEGGRTMKDVDYFQSSGVFKGTKRDMYEGGIRVPFLVRWVGTIPAGIKNDFQGAFWDLYPTFAEIAQVKINKKDPIDGVSLVNTLKGKSKQKRHDALYWEFYEAGGKQALRYQNWKGIRVGLDKNRNAPLELYDLANDPSEKYNIADKHPRVVKKILKLMDKNRKPSELFQFSWEK